MNLLIYGITDFNYMGEFKYFFKWNGVDHKIYYLLVFNRIVSAIFLSVFNNYYISSITILVVLVIASVAIGIRGPYAIKAHTARSVINLIVSAAIICIYFVISLAGPTQGENFYSKLPFLIIALLFAIIFMALGFIIAEIIMRFRKKTEN